MVLPNQLTVLRIILTPVFLYLFLSGDPLLIQISLAVYLIAAITDWYDGWLARKFNYITDWGKFLDPLADKILTSAAFFAFVHLDILELWMVWVIVIRDFVITGLRAYADYKGVSFVTSKSAKIKTFIQMVFIYYLLFIYTMQNTQFFYDGNSEIFNKMFDPNLVYYLMLIITLLTFYTGVEYFYTNRKTIKRLFKIEN
ncbi:CDP-diacylglycerol--glycerol-3-phosphate 3-phosphatidyltransferase [hydrothermal vent metagenome]|uniref:CDP-diacylglycerol--glycerol-3-phosphate 3-phosphatidyltransferase n=1 Tax=hydrothermal vent metagenome TaxID=652676 RepID=A0A3B1BXL4_9ZZZZ